MIRKVQLKDIDEIMLIERQSFPVTWEYSVFLDICLKSGERKSGKQRSLFMDVIEKSSKVIGYAVWELDYRLSRGHILNLAIQTNERRRGLGRMLLSHIVDHLRTNGILTCRLEVRESNIPARALYESSGFFASSKISGYYFEEDAIVYTLNL